MQGFNSLSALGECAKSLQADSPTAAEWFFVLEIGEQKLF
jgi:hypothetical protein